MNWNFDNSYTHLPESFFVRTNPTPVANPKIVIWNSVLAREMGLQNSSTELPIPAIFAGNSVPTGAAPIAQAYAGHQFGHFTMLGDGRAILLGEHIDPNGKRWDIQLKGSGQTPFSRRGDGRAALAPMLREYIISEAMHALGIPTTRSLVVTTTGESVFREDEFPGAVLTRVAASHIRVGTFEYAMARGELEELRALANYSISRHYPECLESENCYRKFLASIVEKQARLIAQWMLVGFIHGVMNTDNMAISGETIDYGPCAFMDQFNPATVFSSIDRNGRYAYGNQPQIAQWNLTRLAETLLPLLDSDINRAAAIAKETIQKFPGIFRGYWLEGMRAKLGLHKKNPEEESLDVALITDWLTLLEKQELDFTNSFRALSMKSPGEFTNLFGVHFSEWLHRWQNHLASEGKSLEEAQAQMQTVNPAIIPRNYLVEDALTNAVKGNYTPLEQLHSALLQPFRETPENEPFRENPPKDPNYKTFCGT